MNYTNISILKDLTDSDDIIMQIIALDAIQEGDYITYDIADEKGCETDEITVQDCIEYLKSHPKRYDRLKQKFFKNRRFIIESMDELEKLQKQGILDKLPTEIEYEYRYYCENLTQEQLEQLIGKNIIFRNNILSGKSFNMICANGFLFETPEYSEECRLDNIDIENIDEIIKNVTKYKEKKFELKINIDSSNFEELRTIINTTLDAENIELHIDINIDDEKELSNIINIVNNARNIRLIHFYAHNNKMSCIEQLLQNIDLLNQTGLSAKTTLHFNLDEEYIKLLNEEEAEKIDNYLTNLKNNGIMVDIDCNDNIFKEMNIGYNNIGDYLKLYNKIQDIIGCIPKDASEIDKITYISNWIMQNYTYDYDAYKKVIDLENEGYFQKTMIGEVQQRIIEASTYKNMLDMLQDNKGVCQNIADLTKLLLEKVGVKCEECSTNRHVFNLVYIEGVPYWLDNTWDVNLYENGTHELSDSPYFLTSSEDFYKTHSEYYSELEKHECPETIDREMIKESLERTAGWEHIVDKSVKGDELYSKTRTGLLTRIGETFKRFFYRGTKEKDEKEEK